MIHDRPMMENESHTVEFFELLNENKTTTKHTIQLWFAIQNGARGKGQTWPNHLHIRKQYSLSDMPPT